MLCGVQLCSLAFRVVIFIAMIICMVVDEINLPDL